VLAGGELIRAAVEPNQRNPRFGCPGFSSPYGYILPEAALAVLDHKFQNQCAVQNASTSLPESLSGLIERVTFFDEDGGFGVLKVKVQGHRDLVTVVGSLPSVSAGEWLTAQGRWVQDREYGQQFRAEMLTSTPPTSKEGIEKYLGSGMVKGIGPVYAKKLVDKFGEGVFDIIEKASARLEDVDGIGPKRRKRIKEAWDEQKVIRNIMLFLHSNGVSTSRAVRIYKDLFSYCSRFVRLHGNPFFSLRPLSPFNFGYGRLRRSLIHLFIALTAKSLQQSILAPLINTPRLFFNQYGHLGRRQPAFLT
jgi:hypothetical protein